MRSGPYSVEFSVFRQPTQDEAGKLCELHLHTYPLLEQALDACKHAIYINCVEEAVVIDRYGQKLVSVCTGRQSRAVVIYTAHGEEIKKEEWADGESEEKGEEFEKADTVPKLLAAGEVN